MEDYTSSDNPQKFLISDNTDIWVASDSKEPYKMLTRKRDIVDFDTYADGSLYWNVKDTQVIKSSNPHYREFTQFYTWKPKAIATDHWNEKLYVIDESVGQINVFDMNSKYHNILLSDLQTPSDLVLDLSISVMFFLQSSDSVSILHYYISIHENHVFQSMKRTNFRMILIEYLIRVTT